MDPTVDARVVGVRHSEATVMWGMQAAAGSADAGMCGVGLARQGARTRTRTLFACLLSLLLTLLLLPRPFCMR